MNSRIMVPSGLALLVMSLAGCQTGSYAQNAALVGAGLGAVTGAVIGDHSGHPEGGALVGAAAGALAGGLAGQAEDLRVERDAAVAQLAAQQQPGLTNQDVIYMMQNGLGEDVIINAVHSRGGRFDVTPAGLVHLRQNGVSDRVIAALQTAPPNRAVVAAGPPPEVVVVRPAPPPPRLHIGIGVGHHHHRHRPHWHHWHYHHCD